MVQNRIIKLNKPFISFAEDPCDNCTDIHHKCIPAPKQKYKKPTANCTCKPCIPTKTYEPICGSNNETYNNTCLMQADSCKNKKNLTTSYEGSCSKYNAIQILLIALKNKYVKIRH